MDEATTPLFDYAIEVGFLPGVTDNVGTTARQMIEDFLAMKFGEGEMVSSSQLYFVRGRLAPDSPAGLAATLANPLVNRVRTKTRQEYGEAGMDRVVPHVELHELPAAERWTLLSRTGISPGWERRGSATRRPASDGARSRSTSPSSTRSATISTGWAENRPT